MLPDKTTATPILVSPVSGAGISSRVNITFQLPEPALPDSVSLRFTTTTASSSVALRLGTLYETAGLHTLVVLKGLSSAATLPGVTSVSPNADLQVGAKYALSVAYRDALANPAATAIVTNVIGGPSSVRWSLITLYLQPSTTAVAVLRTGAVRRVASPMFASAVQARVVLLQDLAFRPRAWSVASLLGIDC